MVFKIKYNNIEAEFEANTKEEIWAAQKLFKTAAYTFREDEIKTSLGMYAITDMRNGTGQPRPNRLDKPRARFDAVTRPEQPEPVNPNGPATEKQIKCLKARHIPFDPSITKAEAYELIGRSSNSPRNLKY